jgi:hypothetical protein
MAVLSSVSFAAVVGKVGQPSIPAWTVFVGFRTKNNVSSRMRAAMKLNNKGRVRDDIATPISNYP